ncbi:D-inositol-3-phosphate glycosyltransferase [uncultured archaeon]|nr:D-inositol-3-phosphate glycosyltransferase [uncultured archaeon]
MRFNPEFTFGFNVRIGFVYDAVYPEVYGGGEWRNWMLARELVSEGCEVDLLCAKLWEGPSTIKREGITLRGVRPALPLYRNGKRSLLQAASYASSVSLALASGVEYDVLDCTAFPYFPAYGVWAVSKLKRNPFTLTWHEVWGGEYWREYLSGNPGAIGEAVEKYASRLPNKHIAVSEFTLNRLMSILDVKKTDATLIPNGVDFENIPSKETPKTVDVIYCGRMLPEKNLMALVEALAILKREGLSLTAHLCGEGPQKNGLIEAARRSHLSSVSFLPYAPSRREYFRRIASARIAVLPSRREGFSFFAADAAACGVPTVTVDSKLNAAADWIEDGKTGFIVGNSPEGIAAAIRSMADEKVVVKLGKNAKNKIKTYTWNASAKKLLDAYEKLEAR